MSDSSLTSIATRNAATLGDLTRQERPAAALTLTRTATLLINAANFAIPWQSQVRGQGLTWSGQNVTIPTAGYYNVQIEMSFTAAATFVAQLYVNTVYVSSFAYYSVAGTVFAGNITRYFATGDVFYIGINASAITTLNRTSEGAQFETPFLHVTQLTGVVT